MAISARQYLLFQIKWNETMALLLPPEAEAHALAILKTVRETIEKAADASTAEIEAYEKAMNEIQRMLRGAGH